MDFSAIFHRSSKDLPGEILKKTEKMAWPENWTTIYYKTYPRLPKIALAHTKRHSDFYSAIEQRDSATESVFDGTPLSKDKLSALLHFSCGITRRQGADAGARAYPSGGSLYPLEIYPMVLVGSEEIPAGIYHYNIRNHALDVLSQRQMDSTEIEQLFLYNWVKRASVVLVITAVFARSQEKYGERGYRYILLEAGHIGQNLYLVSSAEGLKCRAMGGTRDASVEHIIGVDGVSESIVHSVVIGG